MGECIYINFLALSTESAYEQWHTSRYEHNPDLGS